MPPVWWKDWCNERRILFQPGDSDILQKSCKRFRNQEYFIAVRPKGVWISTAALAWRSMSADERDPFVRDVKAHNMKLDEAESAAKLEAAHGPDEAKLEAAHRPETEWELEKRAAEQWQSIFDAFAEEAPAAAAEEQVPEEQALAEQVDEIDAAKKRRKILEDAPGTASLPASPGNESNPGSLSSFSPYSDGDADDGPHSEPEYLQTSAEADRSLLWLVLPLLRIQQELQTPSSPTSESSSSSSATWVFGQAARGRPLAGPGDL
jgi:hypothetical protein